MLVKPVEQRFEIEVDHERLNTEWGTYDLLLEDTTHFKTDLLAHSPERRQYNPAVEQPQMLLLLRRKLVDLVAWLCGKFDKRSCFGVAGLYLCEGEGEWRGGCARWRMRAVLFVCRAKEAHCDTERIVLILVVSSAKCGGMAPFRWCGDGDLCWQLVFDSVGFRISLSACKRVGRRLDARKALSQTRSH